MLSNLFDKKRQTYHTPELRAALKEGYKITKIYSCERYKAKRGLFKEFIECFYKMKIENSEAYTPEQCEAINKGFKDKDLNIVVDSVNTRCNKGQRAIAKLLMNALYGKMGQRSNMSEFARVRNEMDLVSLQCNATVNIKDWNIIHKELLEVEYEKKAGFCNSADFVSPLIAGAITSNARIRLFKFLRSIHPTQLQYCDTDSCYFWYDPKKKEHIHPAIHKDKMIEGVEIGDGLGQWEQEVDDGNMMVCLGSKTYAHTNDNPKNDAIHTKGITVDFRNKDKITFDRMIDIAKQLNEIAPEEQGVLRTRKQLEEMGRPHIQTESRYRFEYKKKTKEILTREEVSKIIQATVGLKRTVKNYVSYPKGYDGIEVI